VPESAIEFKGDSTFVYVISGKAEMPVYTRRAVTTGLSDGVNIQIKSGLSLKDKVRGPQIITDVDTTNE
jgi:HlyD family secretion protein